MLRTRWRTWVRRYTPDFLYDRGVVVPKAADCGDHEWYTSTAAVDACYHCRATRKSIGFVMNEMRAFRMGHRLDGVSIRELIDEGKH